MLQKARKQANSIIDTIYKGYISRSVVVKSLVMPYVRHVCVLLPLVMLNIRHIHLGLHLWVSPKGERLTISPLVMISLVLLQWDVLGSKYHLV